MTCASAGLGVISLNALSYLLVGRVRGKHEYQRPTSTLTDAGDIVRAVVGDPASLDYDLRQWAAAHKAALRAAATGTEPFELPAWFGPLAYDLGSLSIPSATTGGLLLRPARQCADIRRRCEMAPRHPCPRSGLSATRPL